MPLTWDGLKACKVLSGEGRMLNVTLCFSANQALLAAKAGATFISPFIGRLDDINLDGMELIADIREIYDNYGFETQILAASIRTPNHMTEAAKIGADVATAPPDVIRKMEAAGFSMLLLGIESAHDKTLRSMRKGFNTAKIREYLSVLRDRKMMLHGYFILGNIGESVEEMMQMGPFAHEL